MHNLVIGKGEIGTGIMKVLECDGIDIGDTVPEAKVIHICFGYSEKFVTEVFNYIQKTKADLVVIHATVPLGTSKLFNAVHSPVRGRHPNLEEGIRTFVKFFGGQRAEEASQIFKEKGVKVLTTPLAETTEAMKLWDTTIYGLNILIEKEIWEYCKRNGLDFNVVYTEANKTYNEGYKELGEPQFTKYVIEHREGEIGGHCVLPNFGLLDNKFVDELRRIR